MRFPFIVDLAEVPVLCIGGGPVARRKVEPLLSCGAVLHLVSPDAEPALASAAVSWQRRPYAVGDVADHPTARLVVAATSSRDVNDAVEAEAHRLGRWCLRIDGGGAVSLAGLIRRSGVLIAVSTGVPALSQRLRDHVERSLDGRWAAAAEALGVLRADPEVRAALDGQDPAERRRRWQQATAVALEDPSTATPVGPRGMLLEGHDG